MRWGDHVTGWRRLSGKPRDKERLQLQLGWAGRARLRHTAGKEAGFRPPSWGHSRSKRCRSQTVSGLDRRPWEGQPDLGKVILTTVGGGGAVLSAGLRGKDSCVGRDLASAHRVPGVGLIEPLGPVPGLRQRREFGPSQESRKGGKPREPLSPLGWGWGSSRDTACLAHPP